MELRFWHVPIPKKQRQGFAMKSCRYFLLNSSSIAFGQLNFAQQAHFIADQNAAGFQRCVPVEFPVFAVDFAGESKPGFGIAPGVLADAAEFSFQRDGMRDAFDGQIAAELVVGRIIRRGFEYQSFVVFCIEKVCAAEVAVALFAACVDRGGFGRELDGCGGEVIAFGFYFHVEAIEMAGDGGDHHVFDLELDFGVCGIEYPFSCCHVVDLILQLIKIWRKDVGKIGSKTLM